MLKAIDFFCGAGGMTYGFSKAEINVLAGIDNDIECKKTYEINNPKTRFIPEDIKSFREYELAKITGIEKDDESLIFIACSPCQYFSKINTDRANSADSRNLLVDFQRFVKYFKPGYIVIENVPGIWKKIDSPLPEFIKYLASEEYFFAQDVMNAYYYGVPQKRKRYVLLASRGSPSIQIPAPKEENLKVKDIIGENKGFPRIEAGHIDTTDFQHTVAKLFEVNLKRLRKTPHDGGTRLAWKDDPELQINAYKGKDDYFSDVYGRMYWDRHAPTITTRFLSISNGRFAHPDEDRGLSIREGATLQSFPKTYTFKGKNLASIARQIGNAVPPELARRIGKTITDHHKYASI